MSEQIADNWGEQAFHALLWKWLRTHVVEIKYVEDPQGGRVKTLDGVGFKPEDWDHWACQLMVQSHSDQLEVEKSSALLSVDPLNRLARLATLVPTHKHLLSKSDYYKLGTASVQTAEPLKDYEKVVVYVAHDKSLYVRRAQEFEKNFVALARTEAKTGS